MSSTIRINIKVISNCKKDEVFLESENSLKIKTMAIAEKGKANKKIIEILAKQLNIAKSGITIINGEFSTKKVIEISGLNNTLANLIAGSNKV